MKKRITQGQCNVVERNGQLVFTQNSEIMLPEDAPVRLTNARLEELDYRKLYFQEAPLERCFKNGVITWNFRTARRRRSRRGGLQNG